MSRAIDILLVVAVRDQPHRSTTVKHTAVTLKNVTLSYSHRIGSEVMEIRDRSSGDERRQEGIRDQFKHTVWVDDL